LPAVNLFIGGTGVNLAVLVKASADFYKFRERPRIYALDTDTASQQIAERQLGKDLVLAAPGFLDRLKTKATEWQSETWDELWSLRNRSRSFGDVVLRSNADVIKENFEASGGLWTLRSAGWIAFQDIEERNPFFVANIVTALRGIKQNAPELAPVLNVVASIAGGTGSGLFIPMIVAIRAQLEIPFEVNLHVVTPSAFKNNWEHAAERHILESRGESGAYAAYREILQLSRQAEIWSTAEERTVLGRPYHRPGRGDLIQKVFWWGRREMDANSRADDTFYEAGRLVTLLNDANVYAVIGGAQGVANNRRVTGIATIEYPRLERAQAIAAGAIAHLAEQVRSGIDPTSHGSILAEASRPTPQSETPAEPAPPMLNFIHSQRAENQALGTKGSGRAGYADVERSLLDTLSQIRNGLPTVILTNEVTNFVGGNSVWQPNYGGDDDEWRTYLDKAVTRFQELENRTVQEMRGYTKWLLDACESAVMAATATVFRLTRDPITGLPSLPKAREAVVALVEDLDRARLFFEKPFHEAILRDPALQSVQTQAARVEARKTELSNMVESNPDFKRQPPRGLQYHPALQAVVLVVTVGFLLVALAQSAVATVPLLGSAIVAVAAAVSALGRFVGSGVSAVGLPTLRGPQDAVIAAVFAFVVFLLLRWFRERAYKERPQLREEKEAELKDAWADLVRFKMLEMIWTSGAQVAERLAGAVPQEEVGRAREASAGSALEKTFALIRNGENWLTELQSFATTRKQEASKVRPGWIKAVGVAEEPSTSQLASVLPPIRLSPTLQRMANVRQLVDLDLTVETSSDEQKQPGEGAMNIPFSEWKPVDRRSDVEKRAHDERLGRFYLDLEADTLPRVATGGLLQTTLEEALSVAGWSDARLAEYLDELARLARQRGLGADLTAPHQNVTAHLFLPQNVELRVNRALTLARGDHAKYQYVSHLPQTPIATENVGQAIALVHTATFADDGELGAPRLRDIDDVSRASYYGIGHPHGLPHQTRRYSVQNTEFHLLPELSSAAAVEVQAGRDQPVSRTISQRLYGTHQAMRAHPSVLELFYLARWLKLLEESEPEVEPPRTLWSLRIGETPIPLVTWPTVGAAASPRDDAFASARPTIALFDAFRLCMTTPTLNIGDTPSLTLPLNAEIQAARWPTPKIASAIALGREQLVKDWTKLRGEANRSRRDEAYRTMQELAEQDASAMRRPFSEQWLQVVATVFGRGQRNLAGS
jgi:hypothetical protein